MFNYLYFLLNPTTFLSIKTYKQNIENILSTKICPLAKKKQILMTLKSNCHLHCKLNYFRNRINAIFFNLFNSEKMGSFTQGKNQRFLRFNSLETWTHIFTLIQVNLP